MVMGAERSLSHRCAVLSQLPALWLSSVPIIVADHLGTQMCTPLTHTDGERQSLPCGRCDLNIHSGGERFLPDFIDGTDTCQEQGPAPHRG